jgi:hypothetical protein
MIRYVVTYAMANPAVIWRMGPMTDHNDRVLRRGTRMRSPD